MRKITTGRVASAVAALTLTAVLGSLPSGAQASSAATATWTRQTTAAHPSARSGAAMAYDPATGTVLIYGISGGRCSTWTWNGTAWAHQATKTGPIELDSSTMVYDAATGAMVLAGTTGVWSWTGTTWTKQAPA